MHFVIVFTLISVLWLYRDEGRLSENEKIKASTRICRYGIYKRHVCICPFQSKIESREMVKQDKVDIKEIYKIYFFKDIIRFSKYIIF